MWVTADERGRSGSSELVMILQNAYSGVVTVADGSIGSFSKEVHRRDSGNEREGHRKGTKGKPVL